MTTAEGVVRARQSLPARIAARTGGGCCASRWS
ncbi:Carbohydrate ABC transporter permease OS=Streptomyces rimosus subsp. rimosus (strain ATCC /DSM 40260 / JCM 4667 / NRRL 2234) OX=1265868 GN=SRIM_015605 PE=3 SV=1 [Streptomyces rimosus subsp. rimosus]